jgi:hypothetical protein
LGSDAASKAAFGLSILFDPVFAGEFVSETFSLSIIRDSMLREEGVQLKVLAKLWRVESAKTTTTATQNLK